MDQRFEPPLADQEIDGELRAALAVNPSPEFLARVRMRIAREPEPSSWRWSWAFAAVTLSVFAFLAIVLMQHRGWSSETGATRVVDATAPAQGSSAAREDGRRLTDVPMPGDSAGRGAVRNAPMKVVRSEAGVSHRAVQVRVRRSHRLMSFVLVDARETAALKLLLMGIRDGRFDPDPLPRSVPATVPLSPLPAIGIASIDVPALVIEPLNSTVYEGARQ